MAVTRTDLENSVRLLRQLGAQRIVLFGSAVDAPDTARDIDLACEGLPPDRFFYAAGRLLETLGKPVDLVDLSDDNRLTRFIRSRGRVLYEAG
ncbi:MAG: uncharacterized protein QOF78_3324 [Phycisphaerales bacterium]|nr:uncharacterized protein [Phycisphaerales bacterium]